MDDHGQIEQLTLRPDAGQAFGWTVGALAIVAFGIWFVLDAAGGTARLMAVSGIVLGLGVALAAWFGTQWLLPRWYEVHLAPDGIRARTAWQHLDIPWADVESATIRQFAGEPYLRLRVIQQAAGGWVVNPVAIVLPVGIDTAALRMGLARARAIGRLGMEDVLPHA